MTRTRALLLGGLAFVLAAFGMTVATSDARATDECVPSEAWTEVIEHPAVTHVEHHEAETHTEYHFAKYTQTKEGTKHGNSINWGPYGPWSKWMPEQHTSWQLSNAPLGAPAFHGEGHTGNRYWYRVWQARWDGTTREVEDKAAYDETVVDEEAWTETIEHPAVVCEQPPVTETPTPSPTPTEPPVTETPVPTPTDDPTVPTPEIPPVIIEPPVEEPPATMPPVKPGKPDVGTPTTGYMVCEGGTWVVYTDGKRAGSSGTCGEQGQRVPLGAVQEEGF